MVFTPPQNQIPEDWLVKNSRGVFERMLPLLDLHDKQQISSAELCAAFILIFTVLWRGPLWHNGLQQQVWPLKNKSQLSIRQLQLPLPGSLPQNFSVMDLFASTKLRGISERAQRALMAWHNGDYPLELFFHTPPAIELLQKQANGQRVVTLFVKAEELAQKNLGRDPMTFVLHDLEHADEFFHDQDLFSEQKKFYLEIYQRLKKGDFAPCLPDKKFRQEFDYVIADMNSHPEHLRATLDFLLRDFAARKAKQKINSILQST